MTTPNQTVDRRELKTLYRKWPQVCRYLQSYGCDAVTAEDLFQEALLIYIRKKENGLQLEADPFFYVRNTAKLLWMNEARKQAKYIQVPLGDQTETDEPDAWLLKEMQLRAIEQVMQQLGEQCRKLLQLFYGLGMNMLEIASKIGLRNDKVAKAQKYKCLQKAKELVQREMPDVEPLNA